MINRKEINELLIKACERGDLRSVRDLLKKGADIHYKRDLALSSAVKSGKIDVVKFLLISPEIKEHSNLNAENNLAFKLAFENNQNEITKFFIASPELTKRINIHENEDSFFMSVCKKNDIEMIHFLIFDFKIKMTKNIELFLEDKEFSGIKKMFNIRDLKKDIEDIGLGAQENPRYGKYFSYM